MKLGSPGVSDVYQGNELWDLSLVDPDNRRPVDFECRKRALAWITERSHDRVTLVRDLLETREDGRIKLYVTHRLTCLRREKPRLFVGGSYTALRATSPYVVAFARASNGRMLIVAVPVRIATLMRGALAPPLGADVWRDERLIVPGEPGRQFSDLFTGHALKTIEEDGRPGLRLAEVFADFPVAALLSD